MADIAKITLKGESEAKNFIDEALRGDIAYEELSTTVSKAGGYVAGDHLIYLGQYYEVVADIAQGGTIVTSGAGQNVEEREVGDEIKKNKTQYEVMPVASADYLNRVITYIGATTATYTSGQSYQCVYDSVNDTYSWEATSSKVEIDNKTIVENADGELETAVKTFTGKRAAWNALSAEEKAYYDGGIVNFTDDSEDAGSVLGVICDVETSPATAAHSAGDQFYYDGALVEATSAIAIGDTIVVSPDTEYNVKVADKVVAQMQTLENADALKADKDDLASISITGSTNNTGSTISKNTFFYKSGVLVRALLDIANGATLTQNTNYEVVTAGALNVLNASINNMTTPDFANRQTLEVKTTNQTFQSDGFFMFNNFYVSSHSGALPYFDFYINNAGIATGNCIGDNLRVVYPSIPVKKGMTYKYSLSAGTVGGHTGLFIPYIS